VTRSLDGVLGLDQAAIEALEQWRFKPGTKDGKAVDVHVHVELTFTLK
jgi:TonB family protein